MNLLSIHRLGECQFLFQDIFKAGCTYVVVFQEFPIVQQAEYPKARRGALGFFCCFQTYKLEVNIVVLRGVPKGINGLIMPGALICIH